jgi:hypothetical protein
MKKVLENMLDGILVIVVNGQGIKAVVEDQGVCQVFVSDSVEELLKKISTFNPVSCEKEKTQQGGSDDKVGRDD